MSKFFKRLNVSCACLSCLVCLAVNLGISGTSLRAVLQNSLGEFPYLSVYSLLSLGLLGAIIYGNVQVPHSNFIWVPSVLAYKVTKVFMLPALVAIVMGALVKIPTVVKSERGWIMKFLDCRR